MSPARQVLPFVLEPQEGHLQCWAAVAVALMRFYGRGPVPTQAEFAHALLGPNCDQVCAPHVALARAGLRVTGTARPLSRTALWRQLAQGHPVPACMRYFIGWHLVVVHGIDADDMLSVADPLAGPSIVPYREFVRAYRRHYSWTHSYRIRPA